jgi:hypothetical protein
MKRGAGSPGAGSMYRITEAWLRFDYRGWRSIVGCIRSSPIVVPITSPDTMNLDTSILLGMRPSALSSGPGVKPSSGSQFV